MIDIVQKGDPVLRQIAAPVNVADITSPKIQKIIKTMREALTEHDDAVAIAAPQIGEALRIFVVSGKIFDKEYPEKMPENYSEKDLICINPKIVKLSREKKKMPEGCLSVRWYYGDVVRATRTTIEAHDQHGKKYTRGGSELLAQIFQHEVDHLEGVLFVDKADNIENVPPEKQKEVINEKR